MHTRAHPLAVLAALCVGFPAQAAESPPAPLQQELMRDVVAGGRHWRLATEHGAVHLWRPANFSYGSAGTVVYVHGYYTGVDEAWADHRLAEQFRASGRNALFVVPEAPRSKDEEVQWTDLTELLREIRRRARMRIPDGPLVVLGHSGAYRTIASWLGWKRLDEVFLLDALYANEDDFFGWLSSSRRHQAKRLVMVAQETVDQSEEFLKRFPLAAKRAEIPDRPSKLSRRERRSQLLYMRSQYEHMALVTDGKVIPLLLRLTPLPRR